MKLVSVVIPNYNYAHYLPQAIESVLNQTYKNIEIIVVNNGSTDNSLEVLKQYSKKIKIIDQNNRGQAGARNRGIEESNGEFIAFCDADDVWLPQKIEKQINAFTNDKIGLVYTGYKTVDANLITIAENKAINSGNILKLFAQSAAAVIPAGESGVMIRRVCFDEVGTFDVKLSISSGFDLYRRVCQAYEAFAVSEPLFLYRQHGNNMSKKIDDYANDYLYALHKMFSDPGAREILSLRRTCFAKAHLSFAGAYLQARDIKNLSAHLFKASLYSPRELIYAAKLPIRKINRILESQ